MVVFSLCIALVAYTLVSRAWGQCTKCSQVPPTSEINSLLALYESTQGSQWINTWNLTTSNPCGGWFGVVCCRSGNACHVVELTLTANNLVGSIASVIDGMTMLQTLQLSSNHLSNKIPSSIGKLTALTQLQLYSNALTGSIPSTIGNVTSLEVLALNSNALTGSIPSTIGHLRLLEGLYLYSNALTGSIPSTIRNLTSLWYLDLDSNALTGSIPSAIGNLSSLVGLYLDSNALTGSIPSTIGNLTSLEGLYLDSNALTGSIPSAIGHLSSLWYLNLNSNALTGSIPSTIGNLSSLWYLYLNSNALTGSIPSAIGNLSSLGYLALDSNALTGSIPAAIGHLTLLEGLYLNSNALTGSIPSAIWNVTSLYYLDLDSNALTGSIPSAIGYLTLLGYLALDSNALTGSIPSAIGNLTSLESLYLDSNALTGSIPTTIGNMISLLYFDVSSNFLRGEIPELFPIWLRYFFVSDCLLTGVLGSIGGASLVSVSVSGNLISGVAVRQNPSRLQYLSLADNRIVDSPAIDILLRHSFIFLDLSGNRFNSSLPANVWNTSVQQLLLDGNRYTGTFPDRGDRVCSMQYLSVAGNRLWGSLPVDLQQCGQLTNFFASDMQLTGSVSGLFATQPRLQVVVLSNNSFTGPIDDVFAASTASGLILNAAYNHFSGTLPVGSLQTGRYQSLILSSNCLSGTLPGDALCANENLTELILSGLHSSASCRYEVFPTLHKLGVYSSYVETRAVGGTVPGCVFDGLPKLTYLALSGNALTGALPGEVSLPATLQGLDLSHNQLTGSIAADIVAANLTLLDLSFNRLSGTISEQASDVYVRNPAASVSLEVNELSGTLPRSWMEATNINVLGGNLFACEVGRIGETANRPLHDPQHATYACGSSTTNVALVVTLVVVAVVVIVLQWVRWRGSSAACAEWQSMIDELDNAVRPWRLDVWALVSYFVGSMVVYAVLTVTTTVYSETYVWTLSLALQSGVTAGSLTLVWLVLLVCASGRHTHFTKISSPSDSYARTAASMLLVGFLHVFPVFVVNMVYVYTTTLQLRGSVQAVVVLLMSAFKAAWNALVNVYMSSDTHAMGNFLSFTHHDAWYARQLLLWCGLINLIISPVATEALVSPDCFRYLFSPIQANTYSIAGGTCYWITYGTETAVEQVISCMSYSELEQTYNNNVTTWNMYIVSTTTNGEASVVDFQAGFAYNYQCSFSLLQAFVYVFIYKYLLNIAVLPLLWVMLKRLQTWSYARYGMSSAWYRVTTMCLPPMMKLIDDGEIDGSDDLQAMESNRARLVQWEKVDQAKKCEMWLSLRMTGDLAVALSFGVLFPLLGLLAGIGIGSDLLQTIWMTHRLRAHLDRVGRHVISMEAGSGSAGQPAVDDASRQKVDQLQRTEYHRVITKHLDALAKVVPTSVQSTANDLFTVLCFAAVTWALTLYDIVGREEGSVTSLWILVVTLTMPWWIMAPWRAARHWWTSRERPITEERDKGAIELTENPLQAVSDTKIGSVDA